MTEQSSTGRRITLRLNQQQLELLDRTVASGLVKSREELIRHALRSAAASSEAST